MRHVSYVFRLAVIQSWILCVAVLDDVRGAARDFARDELSTELTTLTVMDFHVLHTGFQRQHLREVIVCDVEGQSIYVVSYDDILVE